MNLSGKGATASDKKLPALKSTFLNPNAAEFVPFALRSPSTNSNTTDLSTGLVTYPKPEFGKMVLDRSESSVSNNSDDEVYQYWQHQLPDDITPDFKVMGEDDSQAIDNFSFSSLSLNNVNEASRPPVSLDSGFVAKGQQGLSPRHINRGGLAEKMRYPVSSYSLDPSAATFQHSPTKSWDKQFVSNDQLLANSRERSQYDGQMRQGFVADIQNAEPYLDHADINLLQFLASQFSGFSAESLAEVYYANGGDLNLTIEMLTQLELQSDGDLNQNLSSKTLSAPNLGAADFPALSAGDNQTGAAKFSIGGLHHNVNSYSSNKDGMLQFRSSSSLPTRGATDFASAVRRMAQQDSAMWRYDRNSSPNANVGSSRSSHGLASSYSSGHDRELFGDRVQPRGSSRPAPVWLETGEAVANMYSDMREEARDHARLRNVYFEQARQAYLIGNKAVAKELSVKGQLHNMQMKAAHGKAQESIFRERNPVSPVAPTNGRGKERIIDLHGLHVSEAIHILKRELAVLRNAARSADQRLQAYICVGTGHHTKGSRTPARLPTAVQRYLLEEGLHYSEPQPGLLCVVIY